MRRRSLVLTALLALPVSATAQGIRLPRGGVGRTGTTPEPTAPLPPTVKPVTQALAYKKSRWSAEAYSLVDAIQLPAVSATGTSRYTAAGAGTHADYRLNEHVSTTLDLTSTIPVGSFRSQTVEIGTRYSPFALTNRVRPFIDARAAYLRMTDAFTGQGESSTLPLIVGSNDDIIPGARNSRGLGAVGGAGFEYALTARFAITSELTAMRDRMSTYQLVGLSNGNAQANSPFWATTFRFALGLKFNPASVLQMAQTVAPRVVR